MSKQISGSRHVFMGTCVSRLASRVLLSALASLTGLCFITPLAAQQRPVPRARELRSSQLPPISTRSTALQRSHYGQSPMNYSTALQHSSFSKAPQTEPIFLNIPSFLGVDWYGTGQPYGLPVFDFNGDGIDEIAIVIECRNYYWCDGGLVDTGTGVYASGGEHPYFITQGDFNGDGRPDLVLLNLCSDDYCTSSSIGVLLENADGTFQPAQVYILPYGQTSSLAAGDFNGDGKADLALANGKSIQILLGNGDGTFRAGQTITLSGVPAKYITAADLNSDGRPDLVIAGNSASGVSVLLGNGDGTFQAPQTYSSGGTAQFVVVADFNHDKRPDLAISNGSSIAVLLGNGNGTFQAPQVTSTSLQVLLMTTGDLDANGTLDLVAGDYSAVSVLLGNGDGTFRTGPSYGVANGVAGATWLAVGNFDRNAGLDLAVGLDVYDNYEDDLTFLDNGLITMSGRGDGTFNGPPSHSLGAQPVTPVAMADFTGDKKGDIIAVGGSSLGLLVGNGDGSFQPFVGLNVPASYAVVTADFNGDGKMDLATTGELLLGNGNGTFQAPLQYPVSGSPVAAADFNGDGKPDLVISGSGVINILLGNGDGTFHAAPYTYPMSSSLIAVGDFNGDGKVDVAFLNFDTSVAVLLGNGDGTLQAPVISYPFYEDIYPQAVAALNRGLVVGVNCATDTCPGEPRWYVCQGNADGTFSCDETGDFNNLDVLTVAAGDFNGDGYLDPVAVDRGTTFETIDGLHTPASDQILVGDINGDGKVDIAFATENNTLTVFFSNHVQSPTLTALQSSENPSYVGQTVTFTATVTSQAGNGLTGTVAFEQGHTIMATVPLVNGQASYSATYTTKGSRYITAIYSGDADNLGSTSAVLQQMVDLYPTSTSLVSSLNPSTYGQSVQLTATVSSSAPVAPTGTVTFKNGTSTMGKGTLNNGVASFTTNKLSAGTHRLTAVYSGDAYSHQSTSPVLSQSVLQAVTTTTVTSSKNPSRQGQTVRFTATVSSPTVVPTGTVTFTAGALQLGTVHLAKGKASVATSKLPAGQTEVVATYNGTANIEASAGSMIQTVN